MMPARHASPGEIPVLYRTDGGLCEYMPPSGMRDGNSPSQHEDEFQCPGSTVN
jgi:hypothetical protein